MKNRRTLFIVFAVIALAFIGVGYAALSDSVNLNVTVSGSGADVNQDENLFNVGWRGSGLGIVDEKYNGRITMDLQATGSSSRDNVFKNCELGNIGEDNIQEDTFHKEITITVSGMSNEGDRCYAILLLANAYKISPLTAEVTMTIEIEGDNTYAPAMCVHIGDVDDDDNILEEDGVDSFKITSGWTQEIAIEFIQMNTLLDNSQSYNVTYKITFTAKAVSPSGN